LRRSARACACACACACAYQKFSRALRQARRWPFSRI
jgi:hypothetical protein